MALLLRMPSAPSYLRLASKSILRTRNSCLPTTAWCSKNASFHTRQFSTGHKGRRDPLRVLFCGSDSFSEASLDALIKEHRQNPELIQSIDVAVRPLKPVGRGMKQLAPKGPMHILAEQHNLPLHEIDTFTGWNLPQYTLPINLIIAVSFGLFVPPRILRSAQYGGLNVHPSLLPDLRGPAPIHHAILSRDTHTGVSLQTLSDKTFDAGAILAQTPRPGIPIDPTWDVETLTQRLAIHGAEMLINGLRKGVYIPPYIDLNSNQHHHHHPATTVSATPRHAPKLEKFDYQIKWDSWKASDATVRSVNLQEKLWTTAINKKGQPQRWTIEIQGVKEIPQDHRSLRTEEIKAFYRLNQLHKRKKKIEEAKLGPNATTTSNERETTSEKEKEKCDTAETIEKNLKTIVFRQTLQRPPTTKRPKARSIFNNSVNSTDSSKSDTTTNNNNTDPKNNATAGQDNGQPSPTIDIRLPYFPDKNGRSIIIPLPRGGFLRINTITVEGKKAAPAAVVAEQFTYETQNLGGGDEDGKNDPSIGKEVAKWTVLDVLYAGGKEILGTIFKP